MKNEECETPAKAPTFWLLNSSSLVHRSSSSVHRQRDRGRWLLLAAGVLLLIAVAIKGGEFHPLSLALVAGAAVLCGLGIRSASSGGDPDVNPSHPVAPKSGATRVGHPSAQSRTAWRERIVWWAVALHLGIAMVTLNLVPGEVIDVYTFQQHAAEALMRGTNPYSITQPNIYPHTRFYGPGAVVKGRVQVGFPYPPLSLFFVLPAYLLGDLRYAFVAAMVASAALLARLRPDHLGAGVAVFVLLNPVTFFVLARGWTEPLVLLALCCTLYAAAKRPEWLAAALGAFLATKQYSVLAVPLAGMLLPRFTWKSYGWLLARASAWALAMTAPLALWDARRFLHDVLWFETAQPFREDALSFAVLVPIPLLVVAASVAVATVWCVVKAPRRPAMFAASYAFIMLIFVAINKQAFANYYFLIAATCCAAAVTADSPPAGRSS